jgi:hypothetical protein
MTSGLDRGSVIGVQQHRRANDETRLAVFHDLWQVGGVSAGEAKVGMRLPSSLGAFVSHEVHVAAGQTVHVNARIGAMNSEPFYHNGSDSPVLR